MASDGGPTAATIDGTEAHPRQWPVRYFAAPRCERHLIWLVRLEKLQRHPLPETTIFGPTY